MLIFHSFLLKKNFFGDETGTEICWKFSAFM
jgi:hypothetical protein